MFKFALFTTLLALFAGWAFADNSQACSNQKHRGPAITNAIGKFCQKSNGVIPSAWGNNGMTSNNGNAWVGINGNCRPAQWVPQEYCMSQFWDLCAHGDANGGNQRSFGRNGCQTWTIATKPLGVING